MDSRNFRLDEDGVEILKTRLDNSICRNAIIELNTITKEKRYLVSSSKTSEHVHNSFLWSQTTREIMNSHHVIDFYDRHLGNMYILRNHVATNVISNNRSDTTIESQIGIGWHRDTPQFYNRKDKSVCLGKGIAYQLIIALEETTEKNSTVFLKKSNNWTDYEQHRMYNIDVARYAENKFDKCSLSLQAGEMVVMDDNTFHRAGLPETKSRWMLFISFVPWYIRPYFNYQAIKSNTEFEKHIFGGCIELPDPSSVIKKSFKGVRNK